MTKNLWGQLKLVTHVCRPNQAVPGGSALAKL